MYVGRDSLWKQAQRCHCFTSFDLCMTEAGLVLTQALLLRLLRPVSNRSNLYRCSSEGKSGEAENLAPSQRRPFHLLALWLE